MLESKPQDIERIRIRWNKHAKKYDEYYLNFKGAVEQHIDMTFLKKHLSKNKNIKILDAAGGTGRIALPLAKAGYQVTLCDLSPGMLEVARKKMLKQGVANNVTFFECDICTMSFPDESFDFVLCYGGGIKALKELARVMKKKGRISMCISNRCGTAINEFKEDPAHALELLTSKTDYNYYKNEKYRVVGEKDAGKLMEKEGIERIEIYAYDIWNSLAIPKKVLESRDWDKKFFNQTVEMMLKLAAEPSIRGISRHWVIYGRKK
jgi:ubiquinone/menaquinone biosynthesis C-methylase UbiE